MGTMASLNASLAGSRPTTPHSTVSTMPASQIWLHAPPPPRRLSLDEITPLNDDPTTSADTTCELTPLSPEDAFTQAALGKDSFETPV